MENEEKDTEENIEKKLHSEDDLEYTKHDSNESD